MNMLKCPMNEPVFCQGRWTYLATTNPTSRTGGEKFLCICWFWFGCLSEVVAKRGSMSEIVRWWRKKSGFLTELKHLRSIGSFPAHPTLRISSDEAGIDQADTAKQQGADVHGQVQT